MKVGIWLNETISRELGGGYSYVERLIDLIDNREFSNELEIIFISQTPVRRSYKKDILLLTPLIYNKRISLKQQFIKFLISKSYMLSSFKRNSEKEKYLKNSNSFYIQQLQKENIDVIFYTFQTQCKVIDYPFITTNWDLGHLSMYAFPEVAYNGQLELREKWYQETIKRALAIFVESESGKEELTRFLNINPDRINVVPIFPGCVTKETVSDTQQQDILKKHELRKQEFFFYPAQFWAHKNHYNLLIAFKKFLIENPEIKLVFTGSDKGNLSYIKKQIMTNGLSKNVLCLGFLDLSDINTLYKNAIALVMTTFLGPTNMPLLEARKLGCPVLCSDLKGHREQLENGAIYFNPLESNSIYNSLIKIMDAEFRIHILQKAQVVSEASKFQELSAIEAIEDNFLKIRKYRNCWE